MCMREMLLTTGLAALCAVQMPLTAAAQPAPAAARDHATFAGDMARFIEALRAAPSAPPGPAVVVVHQGRTVFERAYGTRDNRSGARLTLDTPMYNGPAIIVRDSADSLLHVARQQERHLQMIVHVPRLPSSGGIVGQDQGDARPGPHLAAYGRAVTVIGGHGAGPLLAL